MEEFKNLITVVTYGVEGFGVAIIVIGCLVATVRFLLRWRSDPPEAAYHDYRRVVGRSIILIYSRRDRISHADKRRRAPCGARTVRPKKER